MYVLERVLHIFLEGPSSQTCKSPNTIPIMDSRTLYDVWVLGLSGNTFAQRSVPRRTWIASFGLASQRLTISKTDCTRILACGRVLFADAVWSGPRPMVAASGYLGSTEQTLYRLYRSFCCSARGLAARIMGEGGQHPAQPLAANAALWLQEPDATSKGLSKRSLDWHPGEW